MTIGRTDGHGGAPEASITSLDGVRVVDVTTNVAGPFATQILGDLGADVIKVERRTGDDTRGWGPPFWGDAQQSVSFSTLNRNKRSIALDLSDLHDRRILECLIGRADVLVENMRPGAFAGLGFDVGRLNELNPELIYCQITGYGADGPLSQEPAYDPLMQAFSGLMSITGEADRPPVRIPVSVLDKGSGLWAVIGILNALRLRDHGRPGRRVQTSLLETALQWEPVQLAGHIATGDVPEPAGSGTPMISPYQAFAARDQHLIIAAGSQRLWHKLCAVLGRDDLVDDPRFVDNADRVVHRVELTEQLQGVLAGRDAAEWVRLLTDAGVPATLIRRIDQVVPDEQVVATGMLAAVEHPSIDGYTLVNLPILTDGRRFPIDRLPPDLGAHDAEIRDEITGS